MSHYNNNSYCIVIHLYDATSIYCYCNEKNYCNVKNWKCFNSAVAKPCDLDIGYNLYLVIDSISILYSKVKIKK